LTSVDFCVPDNLHSGGQARHNLNLAIMDFARGYLHWQQFGTIL
jgi:hypothetical protein